MMRVTFTSFLRIGKCAEAKYGRRVANDPGFNPRGFTEQAIRMPGTEMKTGGDQPPLAGEGSARRGAASPAGFKPLLGRPVF